MSTFTRLFFADRKPPAAEQESLSGEEVRSPDIVPDAGDEPVRSPDIVPDAAGEPEAQSDENPGVPVSPVTSELPSDGEAPPSQGDPHKPT